MKNWMLCRSTSKWSTTYSQDKWLLGLCVLFCPEHFVLSVSLCSCAFLSRKTVWAKASPTYPTLNPNCYLEVMYHFEIDWDQSHWKFIAVNCHVLQMWNYSVSIFGLVLNRSSPKIFTKCPSEHKSHHKINWQLEYAAIYFSFVLLTGMLEHCLLFKKTCCRFFHAMICARLRS